MKKLINQTRYILGSILAVVGLLLIKLSVLIVEPIDRSTFRELMR